MGFRSLGPVSLTTTTPQPLWGTTLTAAAIPSPDPYTNSYAPGSMLPQQTLAIAAINSHNPFTGTDKVRVGPAAGTGPWDTGQIIKAVDSTHVVVAGLTAAHASGSWIVLADDFARLVVQPATGAAGVIMIGIAPTVSATDYSLIYTIGVPPATGAYGQFELSNTLRNNGIQFDQLWIVGSTGDKYLPYLYQL